MMVKVLTKMIDGSVRLRIAGQPCSMKNSRQIVRARSTGRWASIKSEEAQAYAEDVARQVPLLTPMLDCPLRADIKLYYLDARRDLDEALLLDCLQGRVYKNDRQIIEKHVERFIDRKNPRAEVILLPRNEQWEFF